MIFAGGTDLFQSVELNIVLRLLISIILAVVISLSKDLFKKPVGFRVSVITAIAATTISLVGYYAFSETSGIVIAGLLVAIGIITSSIINNHRGDYQGLVNASTIFLSSIVGIACGSGFLFGALIVTLLTVVAMFILKTTERNMITRGYVLNVIVDSRNPILKTLLDILDSNKLVVSNMSSRIVLFERNECVKVKVEFAKSTNKGEIDKILPIIKDEIKPLSITVRNDTYGVID